MSINREVVKWIMVLWNTMEDLGQRVMKRNLIYIIKSNENRTIGISSLKVILNICIYISYEYADSYPKRNTLDSYERLL